MDKVLVTGATGLVGQFVVQQLVEQGYFVKAFFKNNGYPLPRSLNHPCIEWVEGDLLDYLCLTKVLENIDYVIHAAALVSLNPSKKKEIFKVNVDGTAQLINIALNYPIKKFIYLSSITTLGYSKNAIEINESKNASVSLSSLPYAKSKFLAEMEVWRGAMEGLPIIIVHPSTILGPGNWTRGSTQLFRYVWKKPLFYIDGICNYVDVRDLSKSLCLLLKTNYQNEAFVINAGTISYKSLFSKIAKAFNVRPPRYKISFQWMKIGAFMGWVKYALFKSKKDPIITQESILEAANKGIYSSRKLQQAIPITFNSIDETIQWVYTELKLKYKL